MINDITTKFCPLLMIPHLYIMEGNHHTTYKLLLPIWTPEHQGNLSKLDGPQRSFTPHITLPQSTQSEPRTPNYWEKTERVSTRLSRKKAGELSDYLCLESPWRAYNTTQHSTDPPCNTKTNTSNDWQEVCTTSPAISLPTNNKHTPTQHCIQEGSNTLHLPPYTH